MVTASCRIGYDRSTPDGPLTMKLADTPSRRAGLIISVFGVASSPMASLLAEHRPPGGAASVRGREGTVKERLELGDSRVELRGPTSSFEFELRLRGSRSTARFEVDCEDSSRGLVLEGRLGWFRLCGSLGRGGGVLGGGQLGELDLEQRRAVVLHVLVIDRHQSHLALVDAGPV